MVDQHRVLRLIDRALTKVKANPTDAALRAETADATGRPPLTVRVKWSRCPGRLSRNTRHSGQEGDA